MAQLKAVSSIELAVVPRRRKVPLVRSITLDKAAQVSTALATQVPASVSQAPRGQSASARQATQRPSPWRQTGVGASQADELRQPPSAIGGKTQLPIEASQTSPSGQAAHRSSWADAPRQARPARLRKTTMKKRTPERDTKRAPYD
jgi:hypothetical protein